MITELFVEGFRVDLSQDISSLLTFSLDDVKDFSSRESTYSKTVIMPGSSNNNAVFGNIFELGSSNSYDPGLDNIGYNFNAAISARCIIFQDNIQTFKGTMRLLQINEDNGRLEYEVALNGEMTGLNVALSSKYLTDLDFSEYDTIYSVANIESSWDNASGAGVYFPLIDYGAYSHDKHNWDFHTFRPALFVKEYIDKMFAAANFRYDCDLFNTARFKKLIVPHNQKTLTTQSTTTLSAQKTSSQTVIDSGSPSSSVGTWDGFTGGGFSYSGGQFTYIGATSLTAKITWRIGGQRFAGSGSFRISIRKNGVALASTTIPLVPFTVNYGWQDSVSGVTINTGDILDVFFDTISGFGDKVTFQDNPATLTVENNVAAFLPASYAELLTINQSVPQNIRQIDFLVSIVKLFNLYIFESQFDERVLRISPFVDFYSGDIVDWTYKMDRSQVIKVKPMSELNSKLYKFNYKDDSDFYNDLYKKRYNQSYGSFTFDTEFEFASQENKLELVFASTPIVGYDGEDKVYSTIFKRTGNEPTTTEENVDSVIRIMQTKKMSGVASWNITTPSGATILGTYLTYGYAGHLDDPDAPSNDLNFGALQELFFVLSSGDLSQTQFNVYWSNYMAEITHKDSKMLIAKFYLKPKDIFDLDFAKFVFIDGVLWRLNKITDYNASYPDTCEVELLRVINANYNFTPPTPPETFFWLSDVGEYFIDSDSGKIIVP